LKNEPFLLLLIIDISLMRKNIFIFFAAACILFSCKKDKNTSNTTASTGATATTTTWDGFFQINKNITFNSGSAQILYQAAAGFCSSSFPSFSPGSAILVDSVQLNNSTLYCSTVAKQYIYIDTIGFVSLSGSTHPVNFPYSFRTFGNNGVPSFTYTLNNPIPAFTGYNSLPDTFSAGSALSLNLQGISGADSIYFSISGGTTLTKNVAGNISTITIPASSMSQLSNSGTGTIFITVSKIDTKSFGGKAMNFSTQVRLTKNIIIKN
jgi:hypothetical protein